MIDVGIDWAEDGHQVCILDTDGATLEDFKIHDDAAGTGRRPGVCGQPDVGGPLPRPAHNLGRQVPPGDARVLADPVRTYRNSHRTVAADSELLAAIKVTALTPSPR